MNWHFANFAQPFAFLAFQSFVYRKVRNDLRKGRKEFCIIRGSLYFTKC